MGAKALLLPRLMISELRRNERRPRRGGQALTRPPHDPRPTVSLNLQANHVGLNLDSGPRSIPGQRLNLHEIPQSARLDANLKISCRTLPLGRERPL